MFRSVGLFTIVFTAACERPIDDLRTSAAPSANIPVSLETADAASTEATAAVSSDVAEALPPLVAALEDVALEPEVIEEPLVPIAAYMLRRGESLAHFARWSGLPVETIAEASGLNLDGSYAVGTEIRVPVTPETQAAIEEARENHRTGRIESYLASRGGAITTEFHTVRTGESAWSIARDDLGVPVWVLESYNPTIDLDAIRPGQNLVVPVLADVVVDAE